MAEHSGIGSAHAYIFIEVEPARTRSVLQRLRRIPGTRVREVLGPFDVVMEVEADGPEYIVHMVRDRVRTLNGVVRTVTCPWIE